MFFYIVLSPISTTSGLLSTGNTRKYQQNDVYIYQCDKSHHSLTENQNDLELDLKGFFSLLILFVQELYLMNPTDATLASLSILKY